MSPDPLSIIWCCADIPDPVLASNEVDCLGQSVFDCLINLGLLKQADTAGHVTCRDCTDQHVEEVLPIKSPDGCTRFFIRCPKNGRIEVSRERLLQWTIDYTPLQQVLISAFSAIGDPEEVAPGRIWNIGRAALGGKSRTLWIARGFAWSDSLHLKKVLPMGRSPVIFFLGQPPVAGLMDIPPESIIDLKSIVRIEHDKLIVDKVAVDCQLRQADTTQPGKKTSPKKRAIRAALIDAIKKELKEHLRSAHDHAHVALEKNGEALLLPPPTQKQLAKQLKVHESSISRAIKDKSDREMPILWDIANDVAQILKFKG